MGFFDSVLPGDKTTSVGDQASSASAAVAEVAAPAPAATNDSDFLIIDESVSVANVPDTVAAPAEASASDLVILEDAPAIAETPSEESAPASVLDFSAMSSLSEVPAPETASAEGDGHALASEPVAATSVEESAPITGFLSSVSEETAPASVETHDEPASASLDPEAILLSSISQLESVVSAKEAARDAEMKKAEDLNAQIAELKKQAKEAQETAREIDAGADRARSLIANLKSQIKAAA